MNYRGPDFQVAFRRGATGYGGGDFLLLSICFLAGAVLGMYVGAYASDISDAGGLFSGELSASDGFLGALWECSKYHFLVLLFSTSFLGIFLIPATLAFRGYLLGCASAVIAASAGKGAFWLIMAKFGAVSLITVPCLFVIGCDAMYLARSVSLRGAVVCWIPYAWNAMKVIFPAKRKRLSIR